MKRRKEIGIFITLMMTIAALPLVGSSAKTDVTLDLMITTDFVTGWQDHGLRIKEYGIEDNIWLYTEFSGDDLFDVYVSTDYYYDNGSGMEYKFNWWWTVDGHWESAYMWSWEPMGDYYGPGYGYMECYADQVYIGKSNYYAVGWVQPDPPIITGPVEGTPGEPTDYKFTGAIPNGFDVFYCIDWGDESGAICIGPFESGEEITESHTYAEKGDYTITCTVKDLIDKESEESALAISMPKSKGFDFSFNILERIFELFPNAFQLLRYIRGL